ncbi:MAG: alanine--tRNA ligase [Patescibacteria group bacterium]
MTVSEIRAKYLEYFKNQHHVVIPSVPLVPENDPTTLFVSSGMQPLLPYFLGTPHPQGTRVVNVQPSFRTEDIEEIGDNRHTSSFEMIGNWSFGDYFKKEQLPWFFDFLTNVVGLNPQKLYVTVFAGDESLGIPKDVESIALWKSLFKEKGMEANDVVIGTEENGYRVGMQGARIFAYDAKKNWWSRSGVPSKMPAGEPGGPDSEMFYDFGTPHDLKWGEHCHPNCDCGRFMEIGNSVFMQYIKNADGTFALLPKANVDFGGGLERIAAASVDKGDVFLIDTLLNSIRELSAAGGKNYNDTAYQRSFRIVADHLKGAVFMIADGVIPSNTEQGYILRRLIRRSIFHMDKLNVKTETLGRVLDSIITSYRDAYPKLSVSYQKILSTITEEEIRFRKTLTVGLKEYAKIQGNTISGTEASLLVQTHGFPIEMLVEIAGESGKTVDLKTYEEEKVKHQDLSRAGAEQKFKGGLADSSEQTTKLHTATHLMLAGLRKYLGSHVHQAGSNITSERTRFDFNHPEKVPPEILKKIEEYVNKAIQKKCDMVMVQMPKAQAQAEGVEGSFWEKYPDVVNVYQVVCSDGTIYSRELCGGPHVQNTGSMGTFSIVKEEASSAGIRRIKAILS